MSDWTSLDWFVVGIVVTSTAFALTKGLAREVISLVALLGGFLLAAFFHPRVASWIVDFTRTEAIAKLLAFLMLFLGSLVIGAVAAFVVNRFVKMASLEWIDRFLGGVYGLLRGWAVASIVVLALVAFPVAQESVVSRSVLAPFVLAGARGAVLLVPSHLKERFRGEYQKVVEAWNSGRSAS